MNYKKRKAKIDSKIIKILEDKTNLIAAHSAAAFAYFSNGAQKDGQEFARMAQEEWDYLLKYLAALKRDIEHTEK